MGALLCWRWGKCVLAPDFTHSSGGSCLQVFSLPCGSLMGPDLPDSLSFPQSFTCPTRSPVLSLRVLCSSFWAWCWAASSGQLTTSPPSRSHPRSSSSTCCLLLCWMLDTSCPIDSSLETWVPFYYMLSLALYGMQPPQDCPSTVSSSVV